MNILGTPADSIDAAEDRERFDELLEQCGIPRAEGHHRHSPPRKRSTPPTSWDIRCCCVPPMYWAVRT